MPTSGVVRLASLTWSGAASAKTVILARLPSARHRDAMDRKLLDILCLPRHAPAAGAARQPRPAGAERRDRSRRASRASTAARRPRPLREALVTRDRKIVYRIDDGIPVLLADEAIATAQFAGLPALSMSRRIAPAARRRRRERRRPRAGRGPRQRRRRPPRCCPTAPTAPTLLCKEDAVVCGRPWFDACHRALDPHVRIDWRVRRRRSRRAAGTVLATLQGRARALVSGRTRALNFLQTLSGTATATAAYVAAVARHARADPRHAQDASRACAWRRSTRCACGGGVNHRIGLFDAVMLKENHVARGRLDRGRDRARRARCIRRCR